MKQISNDLIKFPISYINGNYIVTITNNGTKYRNTIENKFIANRPETIDLTISTYCENNCPYCYLNASTNGKHCNIEQFKKWELPPYVEIALNYAPHPHFYEMLKIFYNKKAIVNITFNQNDFIKNYPTILKYQKENLIYGIGISLTEYNNTIKNIIKNFNNIIFHIIIGITSINEILNLQKDNQKILFLGYKNKGRGKNINPDIDSYLKNLNILFNSYTDLHIGFDNLAIEQLNLINFFHENIYEMFYLGNEGTTSFYINAVDQTYSISSTEEQYYNINNLQIMEMYNNVKNKNGYV